MGAPADETNWDSMLGDETISEDGPVANAQETDAENTEEVQEEE